MSDVQTKSARTQSNYYPSSEFDEDFEGPGFDAEGSDEDFEGGKDVNLTRDQWTQLSKKIEGENRPNKSELLKIIREAINADAKGNEVKEGQEYFLLAQKMGEDPASYLFGNGDEDPNAGGALKTKIDDLKKKIEASKMPDDVKIKKKAELDALVDLKPNDENDIEGTLDQVGKEAELYTKYSPATIRLAQNLSGEKGEGVEGTPNSENLPDESTLKNIEEKAKSHGIDLASPPNPPTTEMVEFLKDLSPELKEKFDAVKTAAADRQTFYQGELTQANAVNASNVASTDDDDNKDISHHQNLYNIKYFQDDNSKRYVAAMQDATKDFADLYGAAIGQKVGTVKPETGTGWQAAYNQAKVADQISIGENKLDLFNNTTGEVSVSATPDTENIETVTVKFDGQEDGAWSPVINGYGEQAKTENYDTEVHESKWGKFKGKLGVFKIIPDVLENEWSSLGGMYQGLGDFWSGVKSGDIKGAAGGAWSTVKNGVHAATFGLL